MGTTEPVPDEADHRRLAAGSSEQIEMIGAQRPVSHHPNAQQRMPFLHGEATEEEVRPVNDKKEVAAGPAGSSQPPRAQEGRRKRRRIH